MTPPVSNPWLTPGMLTILTRLRDDPAVDGELVHEPGGGWWLGCDPVSAIPCNRLLRLCLLKRSRWGGTLEIYTLNQEARAILADASYTPKIIRKRPELFPVPRKPGA